VPHDARSGVEVVVDDVAASRGHAHADVTKTLVVAGGVAAEQPTVKRLNVVFRSCNVAVERHRQRQAHVFHLFFLACSCCFDVVQGVW
jgi:hypothetical protein